MADLQSLSDREIEILKLLATGKSNKEIARELQISTNTVKVHARNIFGKLDVASRTEASMVAVRMGLIETGLAAPPEPSSPPEEAPNPVFGLSPAYEAAVLPAPEPRSGPNTQTWILAGILVSLTLLSAIAVRLFNPVAEGAATQSADPVAIESQWKEQPRLPEPRTHAAAVAIDNAVYLIGGLIDGTPTGSGTRLDPGAGEWTMLAPKPTAVSEIQAAVLGGLIYVPGGRLASGELSAALEIYDPRLDRWSTGPSLPGGVSAYALTA
jgi:DNA-binding CsgD family transcriptional regulator